MVKLNMSKNRIKGAEAGKALGDALAANTVLEELDLSENYSGPEFAQEFAVGLGANGALSSLDLGGNKIPAERMDLIQSLCESKQIALVPKKKNESTGEMESTFETIEEWVPPPPEEAWESEREREIEEAERDDD